jgi:hypothetical protein
MKDHLLNIGEAAVGGKSMEKEESDSSDTVSTE